MKKKDISENLFDKTLLYQLNPLVDAQKNFDVMESRLFYLGLQGINPHISENDKYFDTVFPDTVITPDELRKIFGHPQYLKEVNKATDGLIGRYIEIRYGNSFEKYTIFSHIKYIDGKGLMIKFSEEMKPFILDLREGSKIYGFTKLEMQQIFFLESSYAMRLMEMLIKYRNTAKDGIIIREVSMDEVRYILNVPENAYKDRINNFKKRVLDIPINDINTKTRYIVHYDTLKKGRTVSGFRFFCDCNFITKDNNYTETIESNIKMVKKVEVDKNLESRLSNYGFRKKVIKEMLNACDNSTEELEARLNYAELKLNQSGKSIKNIAGFIRNGIIDNWLLDKNDIEQAKEKEIISNADAMVYTDDVRNLFSEEEERTTESRFNIENVSEDLLVRLIRKGIRDKHLDFTCTNALRSKGLSVKRFIEIYGLN